MALWRPRNRPARSGPKREPHDRVLIVCEGRRTEPLYFREIADRYRLSTASIHNMYVRNLVTSYVNRFSELSSGVLIGLDSRDYLIYALCGRSLLETTAILRHYMLREYKPLLDRGTLVATDMKKLIDIDDRHLRGTGFDWESFVLRRYSRLRDGAKAKRGHKPSGRYSEPGAMPRQTPIGRCRVLRPTEGGRELGARFRRA